MPQDSGQGQTANGEAAGLLEATRQLNADAAFWPEFAAYAKACYESEEKRIADFRNWARQLAAAIGVVIGLEVNAAMTLLKEDQSPGTLAAAFFLFSVMTWQLRLVARAVRLGYVGKTLPGQPETPLRLHKAIATYSGNEARATIAAYYANAHQALYKATEELAKNVGDAAYRFGVTLAAFVLALFVGLALFTSGKIASKDATSLYPVSKTATPANPQTHTLTPAQPQPGSSFATPQVSPIP